MHLDPHPRFLLNLRRLLPALRRIGLTTFLGGSALLTSGCDNEEPAAPASELAREVRALRVALEERTAPTTMATPDRVQLDAALQPLREMLQSTVADQQEVRVRQQTLAAELERWAALVAGAVTKEHATALQEIEQRMQKFAAEMQQQDLRHREVQELLRKALEQTGDRLELFLK